MAHEFLYLLGGHTYIMGVTDGMYASSCGQQREEYGRRQHGFCCSARCWVLLMSEPAY